MLQNSEVALADVRAQLEADLEAEVAAHAASQEQVIQPATIRFTDQEEVLQPILPGLQLCFDFLEVDLTKRLCHPCPVACHPLN